MKKKLIFLVSLLALSSLTAFAFGARGHSTVASLADENLSGSVRKKIEHYLGRSMAFYASWMDQYREDPVYKHTTHWHTFPVDGNLNYSDDLLKAKRGNAVWALENAIKVLKDYKNYDDSTVTVNLKYVIHLVGDLHCPSHVKYRDVEMGFKVIPYKGSKESVSYHSVWDAEVIDRYCQAFSPQELARDFNRLSRKEIKEIQKGSVRDWAHENAVNCRQIYDMAHEGDVLFKPFYNPAWPLVQSQITKAGYRLAGILNECFK